MKNKINGIDVSEEIRYCNNCSNLGLDFKTGKFYCGLSNRKDELPEILSCENFSSNCYIKCLQKENEGLKSLNDFNVQKIEVLQEENNILKQAIKNKNFVAIVKENEELKARLKTLDDEVLTIEITPDEFERYKKYEQALKKIRNIAETPIITEKNRFDEITNKINEVLNDRD